MKILVSVIIVIIAIGLAIYTAVKRRNDVLFDESNADVTYTMTTMYGEVVGITADEKNGLSRITMKDTKGKIRYGFSNISVQELNMLYFGKGYVQIPVVTEKTVKLKI